MTGVLHKCCIKEISLKNMQMHIYSCLCIGIITVKQEHKDVEIYIIDKILTRFHPSYLYNIQSRKQWICLLKRVINGTPLDRKETCHYERHYLIGHPLPEGL